MKSAKLVKAAATTCWILTTFALSLHAQIGTASSYLASAGSSRVATNQDVDDLLRLTSAGFNDELVIQQAKSQGKTYLFSADQLNRMERGGVHPVIIKALMDASHTESRILGQPATLQPVVIRSNDLPSGDPSQPTDTGLYVERQGQWVELLPEIVNWKTGGVLKTVASLGVVKGDINGHIQGHSSRSTIAAPVELLVVLPEGTAITEYQLIRLHSNSDNREFRTVTGGILHLSGGATRDAIEFATKKVAPRTYSILLDRSIGTGEYGFLPPPENLAVYRGKIYSFHIAE